MPRTSPNRGPTETQKKGPGEGFQWTPAEKRNWVVLNLLQALAVIALSLWPLLFKEAYVPLVIDYRNVPDNLVVVPPSPRTVEILVRGLKNRVNPLKKKEIPYVVDLSSSRQGMNAYPFQEAATRLPGGLRLLQPGPTILRVKLEEKIRRQLPVHPVLSGKPASGFILAGSKTDPESLWIEGPRSLLESMADIRTKPLDLDNLDESMNKDTLLDLPETVQTMRPGTRVVLSLLIQELVIEKEFSPIPVQSEWPGHRVVISPKVVHLKVRGPLRAVNKLGKKGPKAFIDLTGKGPGTFKVPANIELPAGVILLRASPEVFRVDIQKAKNQENNKEEIHAPGR